MYDFKRDMVFHLRLDSILSSVEAPHLIVALTCLHQFTIPPTITTCPPASFFGVSWEERLVRCDYIQY